MTQVSNSAQTLDGLLTPVAMLFEVLGEAQPFELELALAGTPRSAGHDPAGDGSVEEACRSRNAPPWRGSFLDTLKAAGQTAQKAGLRSVGHLAALLGPYLRQSAAAHDLAEAHKLTAALFSFLAGDLPSEEAHCLLDIVSQWVLPVTPLPLAVKRLVGDSLAIEGQALHRARLTRLADDAPAWQALAQAVPASAALPAPASGVTVARDELAMIASAWLDLAQTLGVVTQADLPALAMAGPGSEERSARQWSDAAEQVENLANALAYMGLDASSAMMQLHVFLFTSLGQNGEQGQATLARRLRLWVALWTQAFRGLQAQQFRKAIALSGEILAAAQRAAPAMLEDCQREFAGLRVIESRRVALRAEPSAAEMSLDVPRDGDPAVLAEMLAELPVLSLAYGDHLRAALAGNAPALAEARRQAHSLKGAAVTVGVAGLAKFAHSLEDLLDLIDEPPAHCAQALRELLIESANLLVVLSDSIARGAPAPGGFMAVQSRMVKAVNEGASRRLQPAAPPVLLTEADLAPQPDVADCLPHAGADPVATISPALVSLQLALAREAGQVASADVKPPAVLGDAHVKAPTALDDALMLGQITQLQAMVASAVSLRSLQSDLGAGLARLRQQVLGLRGADDEAGEDLLALEMQPIASLLPRLNQVLLQAGRLAGKSAMLKLEGGQILVESPLLQQLVDPLSHLLRNALDHGIEAAGERVRQGKPATGQLRLECRRAGDVLEMVLHDDGRGLDLPKIRDKAVAMGLVSAAEAIDCTDEQIAQWIFMAGLSTKAEVGVLSGRGVGMDVVRQALDRLGSELMIETEQGQGTSVHMHLSLQARSRNPTHG